MPIPDFDHNYVLPPHLGNPTDSSQLSPYPTTTLELVTKFSTSKARVNILLKFLEFRLQLQNLKVTSGFQWLDGSFLENTEIAQGRPPNDLDLITVFWGYDDSFLDNLNKQFPAFFDPYLSKMHFMLDHYTVNFSSPNRQDFVADYLRYWIQLFSHNRLRIWKGMLKIQLDTPTDDVNAINYLNSLV